MAESKKRKKDGREVSDDTEIHSWTEGIPLSPRWWAPAFVTLLLLGLVWLIHLLRRLSDPEYLVVEHGDRPGHHDGRIPHDAEVALIAP